MLGKTVDKGTDEEKQASEKHGEFPAEFTRDGGGNQRRQQSGEVQGRREHRQCLAVVLAVLVHRFVGVFLPEH